MSIFVLFSKSSACTLVLRQLNTKTRPFKYIAVKIRSFCDNLGSFARVNYCTTFFNAKTNSCWMATRKARRHFLKNEICHFIWKHKGGILDEKSKRLIIYINTFSFHSNILKNENAEILSELAHFFDSMIEKGRD